jgi:alkylhydroperoxidase family enzyme
MAGSLDGRARRVRRLEGLDRNRERPTPSRTEREAHALDAEIRELEEELRALGVDPYEWRHADDRAGLTFDEEITAIERELGDGDER